MKSRLLGSWSAVLFLLVTSASDAGLVAVSDFNSANNQLVAIDPVTGSGTAIGTLENSMQAFGLSDRNGKLYTFDQASDVVVELDPSTGNTVSTHDVGITTVGEGSIAFRQNGIGFLSTATGPTLWSFDLNTLTSNAISTTAVVFDGLDFDSNGTLYGLRQNGGLSTISDTTGDETIISSFTVFNFVAGLTFSPDGTLYAVLDNSLYTIDPGTGSPTLIGPTGFDGISGLTWIEPTVVPVPAAVWLFGSGLLGLVGVARRKKAA